MNNLGNFGVIPNDSLGNSTMQPPQRKKSGGLPALLGLEYWRALFARAVPVRLIRANIQDVVWVGGVAGSNRHKPLPAPRMTRFTAVELPEGELLRRELRLPTLPDAEIYRAVELDVLGASPFAREDIVWGCQAFPLPDGHQRVTIAISSRQHVQRCLDLARKAFPDLPSPEVWAPGDPAQPLIFRGFGEAARERDAARARAWLAGLLCTFLALLAAAAVSPTVQLRFRALDAEQAYRQLEQQVRPEVRRRDAIYRANEQLASLNEVLSTSVDPVATLELLTRLLPDDTFLSSVRMQGRTVSISGQTANSAALMKALSGQAELQEVRAPTAATKALGASRESFVVEMTLATAATQRTPGVQTPDARPASLPDGVAPGVRP